MKMKLHITLSFTIGPRGPAAAGTRVRHPQDPGQSRAQDERRRHLGDPRGLRCECTIQTILYSRKHNKKKHLGRTTSDGLTYQNLC